MGKWYRIYEVLYNGEVALADDSLANWFDTIEWAETEIESKLRAYPGKQYTILPIYEKTNN